MKIRNEEDYQATLAMIDTLMDAELNTLQGDLLDCLTDLVVDFEAQDE